MFDPAAGGKMLFKLFLGAGNRGHGLIKYDRAARCCALVNGEDMGHVSTFLDLLR